MFRCLHWWLWLYIEEVTQNICINEVCSAMFEDVCDDFVAKLSIQLLENDS